MENRKEFLRDVLKIDSEEEVKKISKKLRDIMAKKIKRRGIIVGLSGGIDSSVTAALAVKAFGPDSRRW